MFEIKWGGRGGTMGCAVRVMYEMKRGRSGTVQHMVMSEMKRGVGRSQSGTVQLMVVSEIKWGKVRGCTAHGDV